VVADALPARGIGRDSDHRGRSATCPARAPDCSGRLAILAGGKVLAAVSTSLIPLIRRRRVIQAVGGQAFFPRLSASSATSPQLRKVAGGIGLLISLYSGGLVGAPGHLLPGNHRREPTNHGVLDAAGRIVERRGYVALRCTESPVRVPGQEDQLACRVLMTVEHVRRCCWTVSGGPRAGVGLAEDPKGCAASSSRRSRRQVGR